MRALSIRQPFAELILRGIKTAELRSRATSIIGEKFYIYAPLRQAQDLKLWSDDLAVPGTITGGSPVPPVPPWMIELAEQVKMIEPDVQGGLPTGVIVVSAVIERCVPLLSINNHQSPLFAWHLADVQRAKRLRKPVGHPQPVWFNPF